MTEQFHLAYQHFQDRNLDQARRAIEQAITMDAGSLPGWELFSFIAEAQSETAVASAALLRLLCLAPNNPTGWFRLGAIVASESNGVGAGQYFRQVAVMQPDNAVAWANAASFMLREGAVSYSAASYEKAFRLGLPFGETESVELAQACAHLSEVACNEQRPNDARLGARQALILSPDRGLALGVMAALDDGIDRNLQRLRCLPRSQPQRLNHAFNLLHRLHRDDEIADWTVANLDRLVAESGILGTEKVTDVDLIEPHLLQCQLDQHILNDDFETVRNIIAPLVADPERWAVGHQDIFKAVTWD